MITERIREIIINGVHTEDMVKAILAEIRGIVPEEKDTSIAYENLDYYEGFNECRKEILKKLGSE